MLVSSIQECPPATSTYNSIWRLVSSIAAVAAIVLSVVTCTQSRVDPGVITLSLAVGVLCLVVVVHARFLSLARDQSRQTSERLSKRDREFQSIFENALDAILILDQNGVCQSASPSAGICFSARSNWIIGRPLRSFYMDTRDFDSMWTQLRV